jgi:hypothetical protein
MKTALQNVLRSILVVPMLTLAVNFALPVGSVLADDGDTSCSTTTLDATSGANCAKGKGTQTNLFGSGGVFSTITNVLLFLIGAVSVIMLIIGGIRYTISGGDSSAVTAAKNTILYAIVGIVVALLAYAIVNFVLGSFNSTSNN